MEVAPPTRYPIPIRPGLCRVLGRSRTGDGFVSALRRLPAHGGAAGWLRRGLRGDEAARVGSSPHARAAREGIFFVRADGKSPPRRVGDASRFPNLRSSPTRTLPSECHLAAAGNPFVVSPDGRKIAFIDFGPDTDGHEAPQVFLLDLRSGQRTQLTHQSRAVSGLDPGICCLDFPQPPNDRLPRGRMGEPFRSRRMARAPRRQSRPPPWPTVRASSRSSTSRARARRSL